MKHYNPLYVLILNLPTYLDVLLAEATKITANASNVEIDLGIRQKGENMPYYFFRQV